jgi:DNA (cytosine-5)-methyltransferase 1
MRSVELLAGCGGLALGVARTGFAHYFIVECNDDSVATLKENKTRKIKHVRHWEIEHCDTRELDFHDLHGVDLLSGGPPYQPFSIGGRHLGPRDRRNMWPEAIRTVREIRPKAFILENVRGLFRPDFSKYLDYITLQLTYADVKRRSHETWRGHLSRLQMHAKPSTVDDYRVIARSINAEDYGAPQKRHRANFNGLASEFGDSWDFPALTHSREPLAWSKLVERNYWERHRARGVVQPAFESEAQTLKRVRSSKNPPKERPWVTVRDAIANLRAPTKREKIPGHWQHPGARVYPNHTGSCFDEPAKALNVGDHGVPAGKACWLLASKVYHISRSAKWHACKVFRITLLSISGNWKSATRQLVTLPLSPANIWSRRLGKSSNAARDGRELSPSLIATSILFAGEG